MIRTARQISIIRDGSVEFHNPEAIVEIQAPEFGLKFSSARAVQGVQEMRECLGLLNELDPDEKKIQEFARLGGHYVLDDSLAEGLRSLGVQLSEHAEIPYTAAFSKTSKEQIEASQKKCWSVGEIREFFAQNGLELSAWRLDAGAEYSLQVVLHAGGENLPCWNALEALDVMESHRQTHLELWVKRSVAIH